MVHLKWLRTQCCHDELNILSLFYLRVLIKPKMNWAEVFFTLFFAFSTCGALVSFLTWKLCDCESFYEGLMMWKMKWEFLDKWPLHDTDKNKYSVIHLRLLKQRANVKLYHSSDLHVYLQAEQSGVLLIPICSSIKPNDCQAVCKEQQYALCGNQRLM